MPNHIQNRLRVIGSPEQTKEVLSFISGTWDDGTAMQMDFNKIVPMPEELHIQIHSGIETWIDICTGKCDLKSFLSNVKAGRSFGAVWTKDANGNGFNDMMSYMSTSNAFETLLGERGRKSVSDFTDEEFELFLQGMKNYRKHGFVSCYNWSIANWHTKWNAYEQNDERNTSDTIHFQTAWSSVPGLIAVLSQKFPEVSIVLTYADEDSGSNTGRLVFKNGEAIEKFNPEGQSREAYDLYFELHPDSRENYKLVGDKYEYIETED